MLLVIDNYDSFTYNLVQYFGELGAEMKVIRNDELSVAEIAELKPERIVVSPGPCTPNEAGVSVEVITELGETTPILGVCLGHQSIAQAFGGDVIRAERLMHGKTSPIIVKKETLPDCLEVTAWTEEDEIMGLKHKELDIHGVQFHPESILTKEGMNLLQNFLKS